MLSPALLIVGAMGLAFHLTTETPMAGVLASGTFQSKESGLIAGGAFEIQENGGKYTLVVKSDFKVSEGPDLYFAFHPLAEPSINGGNAKTGAFRVDPMLRSLNGAQTYEIPAGFDPSKYKSIIIHCWKFNHLYAAAALKLAPTALQRPIAGAPPESRGPSLRRQGGKLLLEPGKTGRGSLDVTGRRQAGLKLPKAP